MVKADVKPIVEFVGWGGLQSQHTSALHAVVDVGGDDSSVVAAAPVTDVNDQELEEQSDEDSIDVEGDAEKQSDGRGVQEK